MAALYGCKPKDPCESEIKSDADKYLLQDILTFEVIDGNKRSLIYSKYQPNEITLYDEKMKIIPFGIGGKGSESGAYFNVKFSDVLVNELVGTGEEFQFNLYLKLKENIDTIHFWANVKQLTCNKTYTDRLQAKHKEFSTQNLILHNGEVKYGTRQPYNRGIQIIK